MSQPVQSLKRRFLFLLWVTPTVVVFWVMVGLIQEFDFDQGKSRAAILASVLVATPVLMYFTRSSGHSDRRGLSELIFAACVTLLGWHFAYFAGVLVDPGVHVIDIGQTTLKAADVLLEAKNPYTEPVNPLSEMSQGRFSYDGFKYLPVMAMIYAPLGCPWREPGLLTTNLLLDISVVVLIFLLGAQMGTRESGLFAAVLYLMVPLVPYEIFHQGVTDLASVVPLLIALLLLQKRPGITGLCIGISVSTKLLPGGLFLLCCLPHRNRWRYITGFMLGLAPSLLFLVLSPANLISNILLFNMQRAVDSTSWLYGMSESVRLLTIAGFSTLIFAAIGYVWFKRPTLAERCGLLVVCVLGVLLSGPVCHRNYQLWWLPFFAVLVGTVTFRSWTALLGPGSETGAHHSLVATERSH